MSASKAKKNNKSVSKKILAVVGIAILAVIIVAIFYFTSGHFYQNATAVSLGDTEYSILDFNYYYERSYQKYADYVYEQYPDTYANYLPSSKIPFSDQQYNDELTWDQYFENQALGLMQELTFLTEMADEADYKLSQEGKAEVNSGIIELSYNVASGGFANIDSYLAATYGKGMDLAHYRAICENYQRAFEYADEKAQDFKFSDKDCADYYDIMQDTYDVVKFRSYEFAITTEDGMDESTARDNAYYAAQEFMNSVKTEEDFIKKALEVAPTEKKKAYENEDATLTSSMIGNIENDKFAEWAIKEGRKAGDIEIVEEDNAYAVLYFIERNDNTYNLVNVRHILVRPETVDSSKYQDDTAGLEVAKAEALAAAKTKAEGILNDWQAEGGTEDQFIELTATKSDDATEGGLYENIYNGQMLKEFNDWIFTAGRKTGDYDIVETTAGYHIIYFVGYGPRYCDFIAQKDLGAQAYKEWYEETYEEAEVTRAWAFKFVK